MGNKIINSSGVYDYKEDPNYDEESGNILESNLEPERELDIELNENEPSFHVDKPLFYSQKQTDLSNRDNTLSVV